MKAQTMTEYLILVCLLAAGSVVVVKKFGDVVRAQISSAAYEIAGEAQSGDSAERVVKDIDKKTRRSMDDFWK